MNRKSILNIIVAMASLMVMVVAGSVAGTSTASAQCTASARSRDHRARCTITCPPPMRCRAVSGAHSVTCECLPPLPPWPPIPWHIVPFEGNDLPCSNMLEAYIRSIGTPEAIALADAFHQTTDAVLSGDNGLYAAAENNYIAVNAGTSPGLEALIDAWFAAHPECDHP